MGFFLRLNAKAKAKKGTDFRTAFFYILYFDAF